MARCFKRSRWNLFQRFDAFGRMPMTGLPFSLQHTPRLIASQCAVVNYRYAIHQQVNNACGKTMRFGIRRVILNLFGIENDDVGKQAFAQQTAFAQAHLLRGQ